MFKIKVKGGAIIKRSSNIDILINNIEIKDLKISLLDAINYTCINDNLNKNFNDEISYGKLYTIYGGICNIKINSYSDILNLFYDDKKKYLNIKELIDKYSNMTFDKSNTELLYKILKTYEGIINN